MAIPLETTYLLFSPAKVNIQLQILARQESGYHHLWMDLFPIDLFDQILLFPAKEELWQKNKNPAEQLLVSCLEKLSFLVNQKIICDFRLVKILPWGAGVGSSSGNAGTLLRFFQQKILPQTAACLMDWEALALSIGSDVPFFLNPQAAIATQRGEKLHPIAFPTPFPVVLYQPPFPHSTQEVFERFDAFGGVVKKIPKKERMSLKEVFHLPPETNQFWNPSLPHFEEFLKIREIFFQFSGVKNVLLTGSGSCLVLYFENQADRDFFFYKQQNQAFRLLNGGQFYSCHLCSKMDLAYFELPR